MPEPSELAAAVTITLKDHVEYAGNSVVSKTLVKQKAGDDYSFCL